MKKTAELLAKWTETKKGVAPNTRCKRINDLLRIADVGFVQPGLHHVGEHSAVLRSH